jgi:hypothetical protein
VLSPTGEFLRAIGHPGKPKAGPYDRLHMDNPAGLAVDSQNQLWVTENDFLAKRVSVWTLDGKLVWAFYGPGKYGGGGSLGAHQSDRFYYADEQKGTSEFRLDWKRGEAELVSVLCRRTPESMKQPFRSAAPETALYRGKQRYFTNCYNTNPTQGHNTAFLYVERGGIARPVAAMGTANEWELLKTPPFRGLWPKGTDPDANKWANGMANQALFIWTDANGDEHAQPNEVKLYHTPVCGLTVMGELSFCIANAGGRALRLAPTGFSPDGAPSHDYARSQVGDHRVAVNGAETSPPRRGCTDGVRLN